MSACTRKPARPATITVRRFAAAYGVTEDSIQRWMLAGKLKYVTSPGGQRRILSSELDRLLEPAS